MGSRPLGQARSLPISVDGAQVGTVTMRLPAPGLQPHDIAFRNGVNQMLVVSGLLAGIVALALGVILSRRASVPVRQLTAAANAWARGNRRRRVDYSSDDEYGAMAASFNAMADSLEDQEQLRRAFAANIAHELRTPLMVLRSQVEAMQDGVMERSDSSLESLHEEVLGLSRLVADLEVLASAAAAKFGLDKRLIELRELVVVAVDEFKLLYPDRTIKADLPKSQVMVEADPGRIQQILGNLLSNALKFTPKGGQVGVNLTISEAHANLEITDSGPGIPEEELESVFDHFFRGRRAKAGGSGIGLTVVRELVSAHGGSVHAVRHEGAGAVFRVSLPLATTGPSPTSWVSSKEPVATR
jgi:two-component system sensor histidine kinase BaeS